MTANISQKSIGVMIDELITTCIKERHQERIPNGSAEITNQVRERKNNLSSAIDQRIELTSEQEHTVGALISSLAQVLLDCWDAQEVVMAEAEDATVAAAAKQAQLLNAQRNKLIREIDTLLGESSLSVTAKTYAQP